MTHENKINLINFICVIWGTAVGVGCTLGYLGRIQKAESLSNKEFRVYENKDGYFKVIDLVDRKEYGIMRNYEGRPFIYQK